MSTQEKLKKTSVYGISVLGAAAVALQNCMAFVSWLSDISNLSNLIKLFLSGFFSFCSGLVNLCMNIGLLKSFAKRLQGKKPALEGGWQKFRYYFGSAIFIGTGLLFSLTAIAFSAVGVLSGIGIAAGVFIALIMMIQELETWLERFDNPKEEKSLWSDIKTWWNTLNPAKAFGFVISLGNVIALSLLFTWGIAAFLISLHVAAYAAAVAGFVVAFTIGAFTEFYFYNHFISEFCENIASNWKKLIKPDGVLLGNGAVVGIASVLINATVNAVLCYAGIFLLGSLLCTAGIAFAPMVFAVLSSIFGGFASLLLGSDFWIKNSKDIIAWFSKKPSMEVLVVTTDPKTYTLRESLPIAPPQQDHNHNTGNSVDQKPTEFPSFTY